MKPTLVGSRALAYWLPEFKPKEDADWDFLRQHTEHEVSRLIDGRKEYHLFSELNNADLIGQYGVYDVEYEYSIMSLEGLALMKRSHLWRAYNFSKHITMYHRYLRKYARWDDPTWVSLLEERIKLTKQAYPQRNPSLDQTNQEFFDDKVLKKFDHDWLHELVAYYERPLFERLKTEDKFDKAWCERTLWDNLPYEDKVRCVAEEAHVIACERFMIPEDWNFSAKRAYYRAVNKVCTTLTSGWFRDFAIDNFPEVIQHFDPQKFDKVRKATQ